MNVQDYKLVSAVQLLDGLKKKDYSSFELVSKHIDIIEKLNPKLNALVVNRYELAIEEAKNADQMRAKMKEEELPPLLGMPITIKEMYDVSGLPTTGGVYKHRDRIAKDDAEVVKRVKQAGAIVLGKTNMSTLTMAHESDNVLFGRTNHWLNQNHTPGGSSGGEGVLIATGASPWGIGSDLGGSIRLPSHLNGVTGLRPTYDRIPTKGEFPSISHHGNMNSAGPLARTVGDVKLLYQILSQHQVEKLSMSNIHLFWLPEISYAPLQKEISLGIRSMVKTLEQEIKRPVIEMNEAIFRNISDLWQTIIIQDGGAALQELIQEDNSFNIYKEVIKLSFGKSQYHKWMLGLLLGAKYVKPNQRKLEEVNKEIKEFKEAFDQSLKDTGVLLLPVFPTTAPKHGKIVNKVLTVRGASIIPYLVIANILGYPAMSIPIGTTTEGFPFGIQIIGNFHQEARVLEVAKWIEQIAGYWENIGGI